MALRRKLYLSFCLSISGPIYQYNLSLLRHDSFLQEKSFSAMNHWLQHLLSHFKPHVFN